MNGVWRQLLCAVNGAVIGGALASGKPWLMIATIPLPVIAIFCFCMASYLDAQRNTEL